MKEDNKTSNVNLVQTNNNEIVDTNTPAQVSNLNTSNQVVSSTNNVSQNVAEQVVTPNQVVLNTNNNNQSITESVVTPTQSKIKVETEIFTGNKKNGNFLFFLVLILLVAGVWFIDDIINYFVEDSGAYYSQRNNEPDSSNLVNGYIKVDNNTSYLKINKIKFYNFRKSSDNLVTFDYVSDKTNYNVNNDGIYIELYDSNEILLYKRHFVLDDKLEKDVVAQYKLYITNSAFKNAFYAKAIIYTKDELKTTQTITCKYEENNNNYNLVFKNTFNFINNGLINYNVSKSINIINETTEGTNYLKDFEKEYNIVTSFEIQNKFDKKSLSYTIDVTDIKNGYTPLYEKDTVQNAILSKEKNKKWICE